MIHADIKNYLQQLDQEQSISADYNEEHKISENLRKISGSILEKEPNYQKTSFEVAEQMAFDYMAAYPGKNDSGWGTYYGPMFVGQNKQGEVVEYPSISNLNKEIISYWAKRAKESKNLILSSRYADLVIDFSEKVLGQKANVELVRIVIDSNMEICEKLLSHPIDCKTKLKRALNLALLINDQARLTKLKNSIVALEKAVGEDDKPGLWGFAFKWLVLEFSKKISLSKQELIDLIQNLESRLIKVSNDPWLTEYLVSLLAEYYAGQKDESNLLRVLEIFEKSLKSNERTNSDALLKSHAYEKMHEIYLKYQDKGFKLVKNAADRISGEVGQLDLDWDKSLKEVSTSIEIKKDEIDAFLRGIFAKDKNLESIIGRMTINLLPKQESAKQNLNNIAKTNPLTFLFSSSIISEDGVLIGKINSFEEDYDKHFQRHFSQHLHFGSIFLSLATDELKKQISKQKITEYLLDSVIFGSDNKEYIERAISAYWDGDYIVSSHLFIPIIESGIRQLIRLCGGVILKPNKIGGYENVALGSLLRTYGKEINSIFEQVYSGMGFYFELVLTNSLGMNLRDDFAHGLGKKKFFSKDVSDRLFHVMLCLLLIKKSQQ